VLDGLSFKQEQSCLSAHTAPKPRFFLLILRRHLYFALAKVESVGHKVKTLRAVNPQGWGLVPVGLFGWVKENLKGNGLSSFFPFPSSFIILAQVCLLVNTSMHTNPQRAGGRFEFIQLNAKSRKHQHKQLAALFPLAFALAFPASYALSMPKGGQGSVA